MEFIGFSIKSLLSRIQSMSGTVRPSRSTVSTELKVCHLFIDLNRFRPSIQHEDVVRLKNPLNMLLIIFLGVPCEMFLSLQLIV